jgi:2-polyprenyl-3-methyl-5-hydroxy-6-metoxy-1,4-benzoquinol methylase
MSGLHQLEVTRGERFEFGANWQRFLACLDEARILEAEKSLASHLGVEDLRGKSFIDVGCGSGLFSLAARRLGARVHSFDFDPRSVACAVELRRRYFPEDPHWQVETGSALDEDYLAKLGSFDVVYSWGVLHHTGSMWPALGNVVPLVASDGKLFISIYNDQGKTSHRWLRVKQMYNALPTALRFLVLWPAAIRLWGPTTVRDILRGRPFATWRQYGKTRGMSAWPDLVDWVGGLPFEVAKPEAIFDFFRARGFVLEQLVTCAGGIGCNEFVFARAHDRLQDR